jgi:hypothetical protein
MQPEQLLEMSQNVKDMIENIQKDIESNADNPTLLIMYANVLLNMSKEILLQTSSPTHTLETFKFFTDLVEQEKNNTTIH